MRKLIGYVVYWEVTKKCTEAEFRYTEKEAKLFKRELEENGWLTVGIVEVETGGEK